MKFHEVTYEPARLFAGVYFLPTQPTQEKTFNAELVFLVHRGVTPENRLIIKWTGHLHFVFH